MNKLNSKIKWNVVVFIIITIMLFWFIGLWIKLLFDYNSYLTAWLLNLTNIQLMSYIIISSIVSLLLPLIISYILVFWFKEFLNKIKWLWNKIKLIIIWFFKNFKYIIFSFLIFFWIVYLFELLIKNIFPQEIWMLWMFSNLNWITLWLFFFLIVIMWSFEEIVFRWLFLSKLLDKIDKKFNTNQNNNLNDNDKNKIRYLYYFIAIFIVALIFMWAHIPQWYWWWTLLSVLFAWTLLWIIFTYFYKIKKIWYYSALSIVIWVHMLNNLLAWWIFIYSSIKENKEKNIKKISNEQKINNSKNNDKNKNEYNFLVKYFSLMNNSKESFVKYNMTLAIVCEDNINWNNKSMNPQICKYYINKYKKWLMNWTISDKSLNYLLIYYEKKIKNILWK